MRREAGFTLLEMLVVIVLLGLMLGLVGTSLVTARHTVAQAERKSERLDEIRAARRFLRHSLSQTVPLRAEDGGAGEAGSNEAGSFRGAPRSMTFYAPLPSSLGGGIRRQRLMFADRRLTVTLARLVGERLEPWGEPQRLLEGVEDVHFTYRGRSPLGEPTGWRDDWPWPRRLPRAVRIDLRLSGGARWITQRVDLRLDLSGGGAG
ncbi:type II secretion system protein GspJ [Halomonas elongata]|uniref:type II secretion system protein GspJ n=1 Tax=Halomonas elongata TaxID=2746 RepID=UPI0040345C54